jgi:hypothetical protein
MLHAYHDYMCFYHWYDILSNSYSLIISLILWKMLKKEGVVEPKLTSKPSFKNIMNLSEAKIPSRSKSKSKSTSQIKVGTVPNKSPRKTIQCPNDSNNVLTNSPRQQNHMSYESELSREQTTNMGRYDDVASEISKRNSVLKIYSYIFLR